MPSTEARFIFTARTGAEANPSRLRFEPCLVSMNALLPMPTPTRDRQFRAIPASGGLMAWLWILSVGIGLWQAWRIEAQTDWIQISRIGGWQRVSTPETGSSDCLAVAWMGHHVCVADANDGLQVIDVRDGSAPVRVGGLATGGLAWDLVVKDSLVYLADAALGLVVIELANPADPRRVGDHAAGGGVLGVAVEGAHAYLASGRSGLQVFDITDPTRPEKVGECGLPGEAVAVALSGPRAYVGTVPAGRLVVVDVADPTHPRVSGGCELGGYPTDIEVTGGRAYVATGVAGLQVVDLREPDRPQALGAWQGDCVVSRVALADGRLWVSGARCELDVLIGTVRVLSIADPAHPERIGGVDEIGSLGLAAAGDRLCVAAGNRGIQIHQFTELPAFIRRFVRDGLLDLSWNQAGTGMMVQRTPRIGTGLWEDVAGSPATNHLSLPAEGGAGFFRLKTPVPDRPSERGDPEGRDVDSLVGGTTVSFAFAWPADLPF